MTTHSRVLVWRIPWTEKPGITKSRTGLKRLRTHTQIGKYPQSRSDLRACLPVPAPEVL